VDEPAEFSDPALELVDLTFDRPDPLALARPRLLELLETAMDPRGEGDRDRGQASPHRGGELVEGHAGRRPVA
jgi:hypothetical protein